MLEKLIENVISLLDPIGVYGLGPLDEYKDVAKYTLELLTQGKYELLKHYLIDQYPTPKSVVPEKVDIAIEILICIKNKFD